MINVPIVNIECTYNGVIEFDNFIENAKSGRFFQKSLRPFYWLQWDHDVLTIKKYIEAAAGTTQITL